jgi:hypothetical protein
LNASREWFSVRVFSTSCDSVSITTIVSKWRPFAFIFHRGNRKVRRTGRDYRHVIFGQNFPEEKKKGSVRWFFVVTQQLFCYCKTS